MYRIGIGVLAITAALLLNGGCGGGDGDDTPTASEILIAGTPGDNGVFDPAPALDGSTTLWMSHSSVNWSTDDPRLSQVHTRIASSSDGGATWVDGGIDPNRSHLTPDFQVTVGAVSVWLTWRFEVSRLFHDPYDTDVNRRWKILWHRILAGPVPPALFDDSWIGYSYAATPDGVWSAERKLFTGSIYNSADMDAIIGAPEFPLNTVFSTGLGGCTLFTEPGVLARSDGIYVSLQCTGAKKIVLLRCDHAFSTCEYLGDLLAASEAAQFSLSGQSLDWFAASELVETPAGVYLLVTGVEEIVADKEYRYSGCLVFRVSDLIHATVERSGGKPVLAARVDGTRDSFNGACGYDKGVDGNGIIYSEYMPDATPQFRLFASHVTLP